MSTPEEYYRSLPPVSKAYGVFCLMTSTASYLGAYNPWAILPLHYNLVFKPPFQIWRLVTNFFFLGNFSSYFAIRLIMIAMYGVSLEKGTFNRRTADFLWMMIFGALSLLVLAAIPIFSSSLLSFSLVFMLLYVWSREYPNDPVSVFGIVFLKGFYLPWLILALDVVFDLPVMPDILGMITGHLYYFLAVLHPRAQGRNLLKTPLWVHRFVAYWGKGYQVNSPFQPDPYAGTAFRGRGNRLGGH